MPALNFTTTLPAVRTERCNRRDTKLSDRHDQYNQWDKDFSARHRVYGWDCPVQNLDAVVSTDGINCNDTTYVESNKFKPVAIIEYKNAHWNMPENWRGAAWAKLLGNMADMMNLPAFLSVYDSSVWWYRVYPINGIAAALVNDSAEFTERQYVTMLYRLRGLVAPADVLARLNDVLPEQLELPAPAARQVLPGHTANQHKDPFACLRRKAFAGLA